MTDCMLAASGAGDGWVMAAVLGILLLAGGVTALVAGRRRGSRGAGILLLVAAIALGSVSVPEPAQAAAGCAVPSAPAAVTVTPTAPVSTPVCGAVPEVAVADQEGVVFTQVREDDVLTVTAAPSSGYAFPAGVTTMWTFDLTPTLERPWPVPDIGTLSVQMGFLFAELPFVGLAHPGDAATAGWITDAYPVRRIRPADGLTIEFSVEGGALAQEIVFYGEYTDSDPVELYRQTFSTTFSGHLEYDALDEEAFIVTWIPMPPYDEQIDAVAFDLQTANPDAVGIVALTTDGAVPTSENDIPPGESTAVVTFDAGPGCPIEERTIPVEIAPRGP